MPAPSRWIAAAAGLFLGASPALQAVVWQSDHWALTAAAEGGLGYDSNLFTRAGGIGDGYAVVIPTLVFKSLHSLTRLEAEASVKSSAYFYLTELNTSDPSLVIRLRHPSDDEALATQEFEARAGRSTDANPEVGGRLRRDSYSAHWSGNIKPAGKLVVLPEAELGHTDYVTPGFNTNQSGAAGVTVAYLANERLQLGTAYNFEYSRSRPDNPLETQTTGRRHLLAFRGRGEFLPKVSGNMLIGVSHNDYRGGFVRRDWDSVAAISLVWAAAARGTLTLKVDRTSYFSPNGSALTRSGLGLEWTQELKGGFYATVGADAADVRYDPLTRNDRSYGTQLRLRYALTERFSASLNAGYTKQDSDDAFGNYERTTVFANLARKF